ncbi:unnamed protein product [Linum tenue]|nr:unnamed protein product [Linum tenue]
MKIPMTWLRRVFIQALSMDEERKLKVVVMMDQQEDGVRVGGISDVQDGRSLRRPRRGERPGSTRKANERHMLTMEQQQQTWKAWEEGGKLEASRVDCVLRQQLLLAWCCVEMDEANAELTDSGSGLLLDETNEQFDVILLSALYRP